MRCRARRGIATLGTAGQGKALMYGDNHRPADPEHYAEIEKLFAGCASRAELATALSVVLCDKEVPRSDVHVAHKRACILKGWE